MNIEKITSPQNPLIKKIQKLGKSTSARRKERIIILDGIHLVQEVINKNLTANIEQVFYTRVSRKNREIFKIIDRIGVKRAIEVSDNVMEKIATTTTPTGIIATYKKPNSPSIGKEKFVVLLDHIADPGNMGTILRTAISMGAQAFFCSPDCVDIWSPKVLRASQGAHFYTKIFDNFDLSTIKEVFDGKIFGTFLDETAQDVFQTDLTGKVGLCFGNEGKGINPQAAKICEKKIYIPMQNDFESLNVGVAAGICCAEKMRQELI